jgi:pilus assembly protein CpaF
VIEPLAINGPVMTIRKFSNAVLSTQNLIDLGSATAPLVAFLSLCVKQRKNIVVSGGTGSGKTTLLNVLSNLIEDGERVLTIEDSAELRLAHSHWVSMEARPSNAEGKGLVSIRDLVRNALRMRPDRIIVGECRGAEAIDMLQAMNTGHDGSLTTVHANTPRDALRRLEAMVLMSGIDMPLQAIREQIVGAVHFVVQQSRLPCGTRVISEESNSGLRYDSAVFRGNYF